MPGGGSLFVGPTKVKMLNSDAVALTEFQVREGCTKKMEKYGLLPQGGEGGSTVVALWRGTSIRYMKRDGPK